MYAEGTAGRGPAGTSARSDRSGRVRDSSPSHRLPAGWPSPRRRQLRRGFSRDMNLKEIVLGLGPQKSLWSVAHLAEEHLRASHGAPRKVIAQAQGLELEVARPKFEGEFHSFALRLRNIGGPIKEMIQGFATQSPVRCELSEKNGTLELLCPGPAGSQATP